MNSDRPSNSQESSDAMDQDDPRGMEQVNAATSLTAATEVEAMDPTNGLPDAIDSASGSRSRAVVPRMEGWKETTASAPVPVKPAPFGFQCTQGDFRYGPSTPFPEGYPRPEYPDFPQGPYVDWAYEQRRRMQEIVPNVFLGPLAAASRNALDIMVAAGLTHVVCVRAPIERAIVRANHPGHFAYLVVEIEDKAHENIIRHFEPVNNFITTALESGGKVLVQGNAGCSRSAALVIAFMMSRYGISVAEAFSHAQQKRFCICPPVQFLNQLREYEPIYRARHTVPLAIPETGNLQTAHRKRSRSDSDDSEEFEVPQHLKGQASSQETMDQD